MLWKLIVPDLDKGDRPFEDRPYGRLRLTESQASRLADILAEELSYLRTERRMAIDRGDTREKARFEDLLKETRKLRDLTNGLRVEKGWG